MQETGLHLKIVEIGQSQLEIAADINIRRTPKYQPEREFNKYLCRFNRYNYCYIFYHVNLVPPKAVAIKTVISLGSTGSTHSAGSAVPCSTVPRICV